MPAKRRWFNLENERQGGWARYKAQNPARVALYSGQGWRTRRAEQLAAHPLCARCGRRATAADHVISLAAGGDFDGELQSLCMPCHREKTLAESHEGMKRAAQRRKIANEKRRSR